MNMATAAQPRLEQSHSILWLRDFLREELAPYPGRLSKVACMVIAATIIMIADMTFKVPNPAFSIIFALVLAREDPEGTVKEAQTMLCSFAIAVVYVLIGAFFSSEDPLFRLVWVIVSFFVIFFVLSVWSNYTAAVRFGYLVVITTPLWDERISAGVKVEYTLWDALTITAASFIAAATVIAFNKLNRTDELTASLVERLHSVEAHLSSYAKGSSNEEAEQAVTRLCVVGTSRMRLVLKRSDFGQDYAERMGAVVGLVGRLVDIAANLIQFPIENVSEETRAELNSLRENIARISADLSNRTTPRRVTAFAGQELAHEVPLLVEMERTVSLLSHAVTEAHGLGALAHSSDSSPSPKRLFAADAFTNRDHLHFAIKGGLAASVCYLTYNLIALPGISTAVTTCYLTALTTIGASRQKQALRFAGALVGGAFGIGAQVFVLPSLDSIAGLLILFLPITILGAWFTTSSPRLSYFGIQIVAAFYLMNLQEFSFQPSLAVARDRIVGILLGLSVMWFVFDQLWSSPAIVEMKRTFIENVRLLAQLTREPTTTNLREAIERSYSLRETINTNFSQVRQHADGVMLEFGSSRKRDLALRARLLRRQPELRLVFITQIAILKYRLQLPGFDLPVRLRKVLRESDIQRAAVLESIADQVAGNMSPTTESVYSSTEVLEQTVRSSLPPGTPGRYARDFQSLLSLARRADGLVRVLQEEI
jgi:multidrug resistance protein MdtO